MFFLGNSDEQRLVKRLRNGDNGAMREFYSIYGDYLAGICSRYVVDEEDQKDVFQDVMYHIITHIHQFEYRGAGSLKAWAARIAVNQSLNYLQKSRHQEFERLDVEVVDVAEDEDPPISGVPPDVVLGMVSQLPAGYRAVFNLYVFELRSHQEIARLLGISEKTSSSQLSRAKNLLARMIRQYNDSNDPRE